MSAKEIFPKLLVWLLAIAPQTARPQQAGSYSIYRPTSYLVAVTDKTGLFSFAAHQHAIIARDWSASFDVRPDNLAGSSAQLKVQTASLVIDDPEVRKQLKLGQGPSPDDVRKIQQRMLGPEVLNTASYPAIEFSTSSVKQSSPGLLQLTGTLSLHGQARIVTVPVHYKAYDNGGLGFYGSFTIRQTDFGMKPETVAGGTVKVKDEVSIRFQLVLVRQ